MKKCALALSMGILLSSCSMKTFPVRELESHYLLKMTSKKEVAMAEKIKIYTSESGVGKPFEVISLNRFQPFALPWPLGNVDEKIAEKFYQKAVKEADSQKGDAVVVVDEIHFKVIRFK